MAVPGVRALGLGRALFGAHHLSEKLLPIDRRALLTQVFAEERLHGLGLLFFGSGALVHSRAAELVGAGVVLTRGQEQLPAAHGFHHLQTT